MPAVNTQADTAFDSVVTPVDMEEQWRAYDQLSPEMRRFLQDAPIDIDCVEVQEAIRLFSRDFGRRGAERFVLEYQREEIAQWVADYRASFDVAPPRRLVRT